jgi:MFS family permease
MNAPTAADGASLSQRNMRCAILSACWGAIPQVMVKDSSIVIIFAALLGAGETVSVLTTAVSDLSLCLLMLPFAALSDRIGVKAQILAAVLVSVAALLLLAATPWLGVAAGVVLLAGLAVFAVAIAAYLAAWFPMLEAVVPAAERGLFFGRLRFRWQLVAMLFIFASGLFVGRFATIGRLQAIIVLAALLSLGRALYVGRIVMPARRAEPPLKLGAALLEALRNRALTGCGVYLFFLYLAANATIPVVFVFARNHLRLADNLIVIFSALAMGGLLVGYSLGGRLVHRYGVKGVLLTAHIGFALLNFLLLTVRSGGPVAVVVLGAILALYGTLVACASIAVSSELLALASPASKAVSIAFGYSLYAAGMGGARMLASLVLGSGILAESWAVGGAVFTRYHSLFLCFACGIVGAMLLLVLVPGVVRDVERLPTG